MSLQRKRIVLDLLLNIISTCVPLAILQLIILPAVAAKLGVVQNGIVITTISLFSLLSIPIGNSLNNIRLLNNAKYSNTHPGDFQILLLASVIANGLLLTLLSILYIGEKQVMSIVLISVIGMMNVLREYAIVTFRIQINYKSILFSNLMLGVGYLAGYGIFIITNIWQMIYVIGSFLSLIYIILRSDIIKDPFKYTKMFRTTTLDFIVLIIASFLGNLITYVDKLIIYPLMGAETVSVYYSATIFAKIISIGITPISGVMLTYMNVRNSVSMQGFKKMLSAATLLGIVGYILCISISKYIMGLLYPMWAERSLTIVPITSATAMLIGIKAMINPFLMKYCKMRWQLIVSSVNIVLYIVLSVVLYMIMGLKGFCIGIFVSVFVTTLLIIMIYIKMQPKSK